VNFTKLAISLLVLTSCLGAQAAPQKEKDRYAGAKKELPEDIYPMYRILERLMQTNKVDDAIGITVRSTSPEECLAMTGNKELCSLVGDLPDVKAKDSMIAWAVQVVSSSNASPNATATGSNNLIRIQKSLINSLSDKPAAIACVVGHELAHLTEKHSKKMSTKMNEMDGIASEKIESAIENAKRAQKSQQMWAAVAMGLNAAAGTYQGALSNYNLANSIQADSAEGAQALRSLLQANYATLRASSPKSLTALESMQGLGAKLIQRTKVDIDSYLDEYRKDLNAFSREQESEADAKGVEYIAKAGINPKGCIEVVELLHRNTGDKSTSQYSSHPGEEERKEKMEKAIAELSPVIRDKHKMQQPKFALLPYVYDQNTQIIRVSPPGTIGLKAGSNQKSSTVEALLGK
jgi:Zn-dependent protease with chaperone function